VDAAFSNASTTAGAAALKKAILQLKNAQDNKLLLLTKLIREKMAATTQQERSNVIVFCCFIETAEYLCDELRVAFPGAFSALLACRHARTLTSVASRLTAVCHRCARADLIVECIAGGADSARAVDLKLRRFAPHAQGVADAAQIRDRIDILVCCDSVSEGVNLQNPDRDAIVVHYDLTWTARALAQRCAAAAMCAVRQHVCAVFVIAARGFKLADSSARFSAERAAWTAHKRCCVASTSSFSFPARKRTR
jgi:ERCC4-related helicase